jgi:hypothetical protein
MEAVRPEEEEQKQEAVVEPPVPEPLHIAEAVRSGVQDDTQAREVLQAELAVLEKLIKDNQKLEKDLLMDIMEAERNGDAEDAIEVVID